MNYIVIAGAGPTGLFLALNLQRLFNTLNPNIRSNFKLTVVDKRAGKYERTNIVARDTVALLEQHFRESFDVPDAGVSSRVFIKDLEKAMYQRIEDNNAKGFNVEFLNYHFHDFEPSKRAVQLIENRTVITPSIQCDIIFDCTGQRHAVVNKLNKRNHHFTFARVVDNPIKSHLTARVVMDSENATLCVENAERDKAEHALTYVRSFEHLRTVFNWQTYREPTFQSDSWREGDRRRFYFYVEMPEGLDASPLKQRSWLAAVLKLRTGRDINFEIDPGDITALAPFQVDPHGIVEVLYSGSNTLPVVVPAGDAQISPDYRLGMGIKSGFKRIAALCRAFEFTEMGLSVNEEKYKELSTQGELGLGLKACLGWHKQLLASNSKSLAAEDKARLNILLPLYQSAQVVKEIGVLSLLLDIYLQLGIQHFRNKEFDQAKKYFLKARAYVESASIVCEEPHNETARVYSNLIFIALKTENYTDGIQLADKLLALIPMEKLSEPFNEKIPFRLLKCYIGVASSEKNEDAHESAIKLHEYLKSITLIWLH